MLKIRALHTKVLEYKNDNEEGIEQVYTDLRGERKSPVIAAMREEVSRTQGGKRTLAAGAATGSCVTNRLVQGSGPRQPGQGTNGARC